MYIHPVLVGVVGTLFVEIIACIVYAVVSGKKK